MTDDPDDPTAQRTVTRRRVLAGVTAGATGVAVLGHLAGDASAQADVSGDLSATGDDATLSEPPAAVTIAADGTYSVETSGSLEQVRLTLQAGVDGDVDDLVHDAQFDTTSGTYDLSADLIADHRDVSASDLMPAAAGETTTTDVRIRVVCSAVRDGSIIAESSIEETVPVTVDKSGVVVSVGGTASATIEAAE